ncbi:MAG: hypothetical protein KGI67_08440 [Pseudomonadota bacterium]|nr:hypothetical protein [Pseudomonadota bacterium]
MSDAGTLLRRYGTRQPASEWLTLRAGDLTAAFDDGSIRALCWRGQEILRGIGYLLRDRDWGTVPAQSGGLRVRCDDDAFELDFELRMRATAGELHCTAKIRGDARGNFRFTVDATADRELATNRCGFVVLHPAHCAGLRLQVTHTDGRQQDAHFPTEISPGQPLFDIRALRHFPAPDLDVSCTLLADLPHDPAGKFEMEDQRNWSDASFKTYVASLLDPWPYRLPAARVLRQSVDLSIRSAEPRAPAATRRRDTRSAPTLSVGAPTGKRFPALGIGVPAGADRLRDPERAAIKALGLGWLVLEADLGDPLVAQQMRAGQTLARACGTRLQLDLIVPDDLAPGAAADLAAATCEGAGCDPDAIRALPRAYLQSYQPTDHWPDLAPLEAYAGALRVRFRRASIGSGMRRRSGLGRGARP